jgi:hypothetical protein
MPQIFHVSFIYHLMCFATANVGWCAEGILVRCCGYFINNSIYVSHSRASSNASSPTIFLMTLSLALFLRKSKKFNKEISKRHFSSITIPITLERKNIQPLMDLLYNKLCASKHEIMANFLDLLSFTIKLPVYCDSQSSESFEIEDMWKVVLWYRRDFQATVDGKIWLLKPWEP